MCEERMVTVVPNQEITAQAGKGFGLGGAFPWASVQQNHMEAWLCTSGCAEQTQVAEQAGLGKLFGGETEDPAGGWELKHRTGRSHLKKLLAFGGMEGCFYFCTLLLVFFFPSNSYQERRERIICCKKLLLKN